MPQTVARYDVGTIFDPDFNSQGHESGGARFWGVTSHIGPLVYKNKDGTTREEKVIADELFKTDSVNSGFGIPVVLLHPPPDGPANGLLAPRSQIVGSTMSQCRTDGDRTKLLYDISIFDPSIVRAVQDREIFNLSMGYNCRVDDDGTQRDRSYWHLALVPQGRASGARILVDGRLDSSDFNPRFDGVELSDRDRQIGDRINAFAALAAYQDSAPSQWSRKDKSVIYFPGRTDMENAVEDRKNMKGDMEYEDGRDMGGDVMPTKNMSDRTNMSYDMEEVSYTDMGGNGQVMRVSAEDADKARQLVEEHEEMYHDMKMGEERADAESWFEIYSKHDMLPRDLQWDDRMDSIGLHKLAIDTANHQDGFCDTLLARHDESAHKGILEGLGSQLVNTRQDTANNFDFAGSLERIAPRQDAYGSSMFIGGPAPGSGADIPGGPNIRSPYGSAGIGSAQPTSPNEWEAKKKRYMKQFKGNYSRT